MTLTIEVTQEDIDNGQKCDANYCPIALAVRQTVKNYRQYLSVQPTVMYVDDGKVIREYKMPAVAEQFVRLFDDDEDVEPFTFTADLKEVYEDREKFLQNTLQ
jgi:hypothetical protein